MNAEAAELWAAVGVLAVFTLTFFIAYRIDNYSVVDAAWSYSVGGGAIFYAVVGPGWTVRRVGIGVLMAGWSLRLGTHILRRLIRSRHEDPRYHEMRTRWTSFYKTKMVAIFLFQAALVWGLDWPALLVSRNRAEQFQWLEWIGFVIALASIAGEAMADRQLQRFKHDPANREQVCATGLWRYSRHPNYFFEWLFWLGIALVAWPSPHGEYGMMAPLMMLIFLGGITGIPPTERQSLRSKGERYRSYQQTTSPFFPWPPRALPTGESSR